MIGGRSQIIYSRQNIIVGMKEVMSDHVAEQLIAVSCASPVIGLEYGVASSSPDMRIAIKGELIRSHGPAVGREEQATFFIK